MQPRATSATSRRTRLYTMYYPHNVHFYMTAALMAGEGQAALASAQKLARLVPDEAAQTIAPAQPIKQAPYFIHAQFSDPQTIPALSPPTEKLPFVVAGWRYARGFPFSLLGKPAEAEQEADAIRIIRSGDLTMFEKANVPARGILEIAEKVVRAKAAVARGGPCRGEATCRGVGDGPGHAPLYGAALLVRSGQPDTFGAILAGINSVLTMEARSYGFPDLVHRNTFCGSYCRLTSASCR